MAYTKKEIAEALKNCETSLDCNYGAEWGYYLHHDGENFAPHCGPGVKTFYSPAPYIDALSAECDAHHPDDPQASAGEFWARVYDTETMGNPGFAGVVVDLMDQVNDWLAGQ